jgi:hypothetical protein
MCGCDLEPGTQLELLCSNEADREAELREVKTSDKPFLVYFIREGKDLTERYYSTHEEALGNARDWVDRGERP